MSRVLPILFNTEMVRAILDDRKTVTRRICKDGDDYSVPDMSFYDADKRTYAVHSYVNKEHTEKLSLAERTCPICPGDILYVRETWCKLGEYHYMADYGTDRDNIFFEAISDSKWRPSIHMPKEAARIWLKVHDVRVERLHEMRLDDFLKEGVVIREESFNDPENAHQQARAAFKDIWDSTVKKSALDIYGWNANPYTWAIEFERCEKPEVENAKEVK